MYCDECGKKVSVDAAFCNGCGTPIERDELEIAIEEEIKSAEFDEAVSHRLGNVTRLRGTAAAIFAGIFVFFGIIGLFFAEEGMGTILIYPALVLINLGIVLVPNFIAQYGSKGSFDPMTFAKGNMIVSFVNIGAFLIMLLAGDGHIISLLILIPDFLLLTQVKMIFNLIGRISPPATTNATATPHSNVYEVEQTVFARWDSGEVYYPGIISAVNGSQLDISFLDGDKGTIPSADVLELHEAFRTLKLHGNFRNGGEWYSGKISKTQPLTMQYDDGDVEEIKLEQLQGVL